MSHGFNVKSQEGGAANIYYNVQNKQSLASQSLEYKYTSNYENIKCSSVLQNIGLSTIENAKEVVLPMGVNGVCKEVLLLNPHLQVDLHYNITEKMILNYNTPYCKFLCLQNKWTRLQ